MHSNSTLRNNYDITVVGAGPAGLCAALSCLKTEKEASILLVDKISPWKKPIACAEGTGKLGLEEAIEVDPSWVRFLVERAEFHAPNRKAIHYTDKNKGYIIDRARMQKDLAQRCRDSGTQCHFGLQVKSVGSLENGHRQVTFSSGETIRTRVLIDASGPLSRLGRHETIPWKSNDLEPAYFAVVEGLSYPTNTIRIYMGRELAPGGYAWLFPREEGVANVGIVIGSKAKGRVNIRSLLDNFLRETFPKGRVVTTFAGSIPCACERRTLAVEGLIKAGDAAGTANPISRAGIVEAMISGTLAGECATAMLGASDGKEMKKACTGYEKAWMDKRGRQHLKLAKVKGAMARIPDSDYNAAAEALSRIPSDELLMSKVFKMSLGRFPRLVWAMRHLL